jgi:ergothioneine biosynthesis protein EgtB
MHPSRESLLARFRAVRGESVRICAPLEPDDYVVQPVDFVSPPKWHLGHTTWFFETFFPCRYLKNYRRVDDRYPYVFNSYYEALGERILRPRRGSLSRPTVKDVYAYRARVDEAVEKAIGAVGDSDWPAFAATFELGLHHEQQHQELLMMDIKYILGGNPLHPAYCEADARSSAATPPLKFLPVKGGVSEIGDRTDGFAFDNERPRHQVLTRDFLLGSRLITNGEYRAFLGDGGYRRPEFWLSDGWATIQQEQWHAPLYWDLVDGEWHEFTLAGLAPVDDDSPVCHVSYYEADAFAKWSGKRLPTEQEWEVAAQQFKACGDAGTFLDGSLCHPAHARDGGSEPSQMLGDLWEWTGSAYLPYPGYVPFAGALGEYNGKFMINQMVLRGGCCATPRDHIRASYRNFFQPNMRWAFSGIRLAADA